MRPAPLFGTVAIAGVGLIGGSIGLGIRQRFLAEKVVGLDRDPVSLEAARGMGAVDEAQLTPGHWLAEADLVLLATPVRSIARVAGELEPYLKPDAIITDVGGVKQEIVEALSHLRFVGGHPMAGSEKIGVQNADPALLENAVWVLTPSSETDPEALQRVELLVTQLGARPLQVAPAQHDRLVASVSHVPYLTALALTRLVATDQDRDLMTLLAAGGFRDLTRVASGSPRMSRDMVTGNAAQVREAAESLIAHLRHLTGLLDDAEELLDEAQAGKRVRDSLPIVRRTLFPTRYEVVIAVPDRPGELARITNALGDAGVNIRDIEVLGIRESGGAIRLAFNDEDGLQRGTETLRAAGYEARARLGNGSN